MLLDESVAENSCAVFNDVHSARVIVNLIKEGVSGHGNIITGPNGMNPMHVTRIYVLVHHPGHWSSTIREASVARFALQF